MSTRVFVPALDSLVFDRPAAWPSSGLVPFQARLPCFRWAAVIGDDREPVRVITEMSQDYQPDEAD
ncbi:MAG: hypothetical protein R3200_12680 [Xanthomonadales bacterium]|nr:hypothetical protein [Xanthomonadales bacterium]